MALVCSVRVCRGAALALATLVLALAPSAATAGPPSAAASPSAAATPGRGCSLDAAPIGIEAAFAHELDDRRMLRFLVALAAAPRDVQRTVLDRASAVGSTAAYRATRARLVALCETDVAGSAADQARYAAARGAVLVANRWLLDERSNAEFAGFSQALETATAALALGARVPAATAAVALAPFAAFVAASEPGTAAGASATAASLTASSNVPSPTASDAAQSATTSASGTAPASPSARNSSPAANCVSPNLPASVAQLVPPLYPETARLGRVTGLVRIVVELDDAGLVRSLHPSSSTLTQGTGEEDLVLASLVSAAETTYTPALTGCIAHGGRFLFEASFARR